MPDSLLSTLPFSVASRGSSTDEPAMVVVSGGQSGVGATSLTLGLADALTQEALRIVVIDADRQRSTLSSAAGIQPSIGIDEVLSGRKTIHEALARGRAGLQILAGSPSPAGLALSQRAIDRLVRQIHTLARHCDLLLIDAGSEPSELMARLWQLAHTILLVTSPEAAAVMDAYALLKRLLNDQPLRNAPTLVVSQAASGDQAADVHRRIDQSTRRFLGLPVSLGGFVPYVKAGAAGVGGPVPQAKAYGELAKQLVARIKPGSQPLAA